MSAPPRATKPRSTPLRLPLQAGKVPHAQLTDNRNRAYQPWYAGVPARLGRREGTDSGGVVEYMVPGNGWRNGLKQGRLVAYNGLLMKLLTINACRCKKNYIVGYLMLMQGMSLDIAAVRMRHVG